MLERAVELEPESQKGLWLLGIAAAQEGDLARAVSRWESLLGLLEPGSGVAQSVQQQIDEANARLGRPAAAAVADTGSATAPASDTGGWSGTPVRVAASESSASLIPSGAVLFVIVRSPGPAVGPPLGVRRVIDPILPLDLTITDGDSMLEERKISLESEVQLQARISLSGSPTTSPGDWQSAPVSVALDGVSSVQLIIDQQVE
jgi:cytochrome c-type biogenesis protein CcmH